MTIQITRNQFYAKKLELINNGVTFRELSPDEGTASHAGVDVKYKLFSDENKLTLTVVRRPFLVALFTVESVIKKWFEGQ